jgi:hypothetical protein
MLVRKAAMLALGWENTTDYQTIEFFAPLEGTLAPKGQKNAFQRGENLFWL